MMRRYFTRAGARRVGVSSASSCCLFLCLTAISQAATVGVEPDPVDPANLERIHFAAAAGERNSLLIRGRFVPTGDPIAPFRATWTFHDLGADVEPGASCVSLDAHTVECAARPYEISKVHVTLGDLDDELTVSADTPQSATFTDVHAGGGNDRLASMIANATALHGDADDDEL